MKQHKIKVVVYAMDDNGNQYEAEVERAPFETRTMFKERVGIVIDERVHRAGGLFVGED